MIMIMIIIARIITITLIAIIFSPDQHHPQGESLPVSQSLPVQQELGATGIQHRKIHIINHPIGKLAKLFYTTSGCDGCDKYEVYWYSRSQESYPL